ncbi:hypothetical protein ACIPT0_17210 [Pectobacterium sp. CHL-2024]
MLDKYAIAPIIIFQPSTGDGSERENKMLDNYFAGTSKTEEEAITKAQRLLAVQAALEIAKASVGSSDVAASCKTDVELKYVAQHVSGLADAIQEALKAK